MKFSSDDISNWIYHLLFILSVGVIILKYLNISPFSDNFTIGIILIAGVLGAIIEWYRIYKLSKESTKNGSTYYLNQPTIRRLKLFSIPLILSAMLFPNNLAEMFFWFGLIALIEEMVRFLMQKILKYPRIVLTNSYQLIYYGPKKVTIRLIDIRKMNIENNLFSIKTSQENIVINMSKMRTEKRNDFIKYFVIHSKLQRLSIEKGTHKKEDFLNS